MTVTLLCIALATALATVCGGLFALRYKDKSHLIIGFSAGAVIGVAFFDLLPEALEAGMTYGVETITTLVALGFVLYLIFDRLFYHHAIEHVHHESPARSSISPRSYRGILRAASLSFHSFLDGVGIGLAFQISPMLGGVVTVAVLAHDFSDGINTVTSIMKSGGGKQTAFMWLGIDAFAPILGILVTFFFTVSESLLGIILALFCGFFLYIGASDLVPESYHAHPTKGTTIATIIGALLIYIVIHLAH